MGFFICLDAGEAEAEGAEGPAASGESERESTERKSDCQEQGITNLRETATRVRKNNRRRKKEVIAALKHLH